MPAGRSKLALLHNTILGMLQNAFSEKKQDLSGDFLLLHL